MAQEVQILGQKKSAKILKPDAKKDDKVCLLHSSPKKWTFFVSVQKGD